jgi:tetratricopeptide (TPR) repeat protein
MIHLLLAFLLFPSSLGGVASIEKGDREFKAMQYMRAAAQYDTALSVSVDSSSVLWRLARAWICYADTANPDRKFDLYKHAESFARRAVRADSTSSQAHAWLAAALGNVAMFEGGKTKVSLAHAIKREVDRAITLDGNNDVAWSILGSFHKAIGDVSWIEKQLANVFLGGLPDGGYGESEMAFHRAIALAPGTVRNHFELAQVYISLSRKKEAMDELRLTQTLPAGVASDYRLKRWTASLIKQLEN